MMVFALLFLCVLPISLIHSMNDPKKHRPIDSSALEDKPNVFDVVKRERLTCFLNDKTKNDTDELIDEQPDLTHQDESLQDYVSQRLQEQLNPSDTLKLRKTCALLKKSNYWPKTTCLLDDSTLDDLELLKGKQATAQCSVVEKLKTESSTGHVTSCAQLLAPLTRCADLNLRKHKVQEVRRVCRELQPLLSQVGESENAFLAFYQLQEEDDFFTFVLQTEQAKLPFAKKNKIVADLQAAWNRNETCILIQSLYPHLIQSISLIADGNKNYYKWTHGEIQTEEQYVKMFSEMGLDLTPPIATPEGLIHRTLKLVLPEKWAQFLGYGLNLVHQGRSSSDVLESMQARLTATKCMQKKLIALNQFIKGTQSIASLLEKSEATSLHELAQKLRLPDTPKIKELMASLNTSTFTGQESCWSHWGRIKATYKLMNECKNELLKMYGALGELDFLNAGVRLAIDSPSAFCLPTFIESDKPGLEISDCWNILRAPAHSVKNSVAMGTVAGKELPRSLIITGPNGQGKTENMLAPFYAALLAQSIGVAPGKKIVMVPCQQFITRLKAETNISDDRSLFMADAERMATILDKIEQEKGITFVVLDEPGIGTKSKLARSLVKVLVEEIAHNKRTLCQTTTHFDRPTILAASEPQIFANRKAVAYRLEPGIGSFEKEDAGIAIVEKSLGKRIVEKVKQDMTDLEGSSSDVNIDKELNELGQLLDTLGESFRELRRDSLED